MPDGFGSVSFGVLISKPGGGAQSDYNVVHIPGGSVNYVDIGGKLPTEFDVSLYLANSSDYNSLLALVGTQATATIHGTAYNNTLLVSVSRTSINPVFADALFITP